MMPAQQKASQFPRPLADMPRSHRNNSVRNRSEAYDYILRERGMCPGPGAAPPKDLGFVHWVTQRHSVHLQLQLADQS